MVGQFHPFRAKKILLLLLLVAFGLSGCFTKTIIRGNVISNTALEQIPVGSSKDQVLIVLGTPSVVTTFDSEVFYYIWQKKQQTAFLSPRIVEQRVVAIYFSSSEQVRSIAHYAMKDGRIFDFINKKTITSGKEFSFLSQLLQGALSTQPLGIPK